MNKAKHSSNMHRLVRLTLINWYLFDYEDITIDVDVALFKGVNGAGKSSLADALQTIFAGGDETKIALNAASGDNKQSGRSVLSYVLGIVAESGGMKAVQPRKSSNCYLAVTFQRPDNSRYSFGVSLFARSGDKKVKKERFIIDGLDLSSMDFMDGSTTIVPWSTMQKRLQIMPATVSFPNNASDYRRQYCELMSGSGANQQIASNMMLQAFKNGIAFKEEKSINDFIWNYILPKRAIDVDRIENDYSEYQQIEELIATTEEKLSLLKKIVSSYTRYEQKHNSALAYQWCELEAICLGTDDKLNKKQDEASNLKLKLDANNDKLNTLTENVEKLQKISDEAKSAWLGSKTYQEKQNLSDKLADKKQLRETRKKLLDQSHEQLQKISEFFWPEFEDPKLYDLARSIQSNLIAIVDSNNDLLSHPWYFSLEGIEQALIELKKLRELSLEFQNESSNSKQRTAILTKGFNELRAAFEDSQQGKVRVSKSTSHVIDLLKSYGIDAKPVCDLASISDDEWQFSIESFLRNNREALVISGQDYTQALKLYRQEKNRHRHIRQVKLINPDKGFGFEGTPSSDSAASLIESDNPIALKFLRGLLHNVKLVDTEDELRHEKRAISKDGMVSGSGAISGGGKPIDSIMLGIEARKKHALTLQKKINQQAPLLAQAQNNHNAFESLVNEFIPSLTTAINSCTPLSCSLKEYNEFDLVIQKLELELSRLDEECDKKLEEYSIEAGRLFDEENNKLNELKVDVGIQEKNLGSLATRINQLSTEYKELVSKRKVFETTHQLSFDLANEKLETLTNLLDENYGELAEQARLKAESAQTASNNALRNAGELLAQYCSYFDPEDKKELAELNQSQPLLASKRCQIHVNRIEKTELAKYGLDSIRARETMLKNFRAEVVANLKESFQQIKQTFTILNDQLAELTFNNNVYQFLYPLTGIDSLKKIYDYVTDTSDLDIENVGTMFDEHKDDPAVSIIENLLLDGRLREISDYRNFFSYDIQSKDINTDTKRKFSELLKTGSGGEKQAPFYVALGASFMTAYRIHKFGDHVEGGAAIAIFDEAFSKMDGNNAKAALSFFREIGLQVIIAAPPESEIKTGPYVDKTYTILRNGDQVYIDYHAYKDDGKKLLESDDHNTNPEVLSALIKEVEREFGDKQID
ncbi:SbcC/MukB-like Walker B domain-containing protein [Vibrio sp. Isolate24]|uniref:SbcC/MukB-like Walker B domain-containing protein n=1 Tax=Vibrio sp. Isolate24 TaxID=2908534 RepID=UPI001EFCCDD6|nr:SbcC/MukB-like Walker B domain-containing protein [Vibrio sp. Isolate24]MCG9678968.1 hypothetical protein [Vibrio sp. Isolate24]